MTVNELLNHLMQALQKKQIDGQAEVLVESQSSELLRDVEKVTISSSVPNQVILEY